MSSTPTAEHLFTSPRLSARLLAPGDEAVLQEVFVAAGDYFLDLTGRPEPNDNAAEREIEATLTVPGRRVALLRLGEGEEGDAVGALGWWENHPEPDLALLGMVIVVPAHRGAGLAKEAVEALEGALAERGITRLRTGVGAGDTQKQALLRALGFAPMEERAHIDLDRGRVMIALFEKQL